MLATIVGHADFRRAERVGLDHVRARLEIGGVNCANYIRTCNRQQVIIALLIMRHFKCAAIIAFGQSIALNRRAIAAVENKNLLSRPGDKCFARVHTAASCTSADGRFPSKWHIA